MYVFALHDSQNNNYLLQNIN